MTGYHENLAVNLSQKYDLAFDVAEHLVRNYGTRASWLRIESSVQENDIPQNVCLMCALGWGNPWNGRPGHGQRLGSPSLVIVFIGGKPNMPWCVYGMLTGDMIKTCCTRKKMPFFFGIQTMNPVLQNWWKKTLRMSQFLCFRLAVWIVQALSQIVRGRSCHNWLPVLRSRSAICCDLTDFLLHQTIAIRWSHETINMQV